MKAIFTDIHWRNSDDSDVLNMHAIKSIELENGICTITCATGIYKSPYADLTFGGGVEHISFVVMIPYSKTLEWMEIAIFTSSSKVAIVPHSKYKEGHWFYNKCKRFCV
jgi:hypothetical protein